MPTPTPAQRLIELEQRVQQLTTELASRRLSSASCSVLNADAASGALLQQRYLYKVDEDGMFAVPRHLRRFSMDVGFNVGTVLVGDWLRWKPDLFGIGIEANPYLCALFDSVTAAGFEGLYWRPTDHPAVETARAFRNASDRALLINAAVTTSAKRALPFNLGFGWTEDGAVTPDVGSLYDFEDYFRRHRQRMQHVATIRLDDILAHVPQRLLWDTLKIDIQGSDVEALQSAGEYLSKFLCVVGEFRAQNYHVPKIPGGHRALARDLLNRTGFFIAWDTAFNQVWLNRRFHATFANVSARDYTCATSGISGHNKTIDGNKWGRVAFAKAARKMAEEQSRCRKSGRCTLGPGS